MAAGRERSGQKESGFKTASTETWHSAPWTGWMPASRLQTLILALGLGALNVLAFAPVGFWPLQILTLAFVFHLVLHAPSPRSAALLGWAYGFGWLATGVHWLYISMHTYGGMPSWMAILAVAALSLYLGAYPALATGCAAWLARRLAATKGVIALLLLPGLWTLAEWLRGWVLTGFPWLSSGYAHTIGPLAGFAPLVGVYGLALIAAWIAGALALLPSAKRPAVLSVLLLAAGFGLKSVDWTQPSGKPVSVRLLQGNVAQELKFAPEELRNTLALYRDAIVSEPADLIATPETAIPLLSRQLPPDYLSQLSDFAKRSGSHIALGIPISDGPQQYANSVLGLSPSDANTYRYDKHHLVPFGEFIPYGARWFVDLMRIPLGDFNRGDLLQAPFRVGDQWVLPNICYEDLFGEEIAAQIAAGKASSMPQATILLNMSNIAWFGDSIALPQHLQISQMRALETGRPMMRATNTGATAVVDPKGEIAARLPYFTRGTLATDVQGYTGLTPYVRLGNAAPVGIAVFLLGIAFGLSRRKRNNPHKPLENR